MNARIVIALLAGLPTYLFFGALDLAMEDVTKKHVQAHQKALNTPVMPSRAILPQPQSAQTVAVVQSQRTAP